MDDVMVLPDDDYYWGKIFITVVMFGLLVDSLGMAAVYVQYKVKSDLLIPMLAFYSLLVPATMAGTVIAAINIRFEFSYNAQSLATDLKKSGDSRYKTSLAKVVVVANSKTKIGQ